MKQKMRTPVRLLLASAALLSFCVVTTPAFAQTKDGSRPPVQIKDARITSDTLTTQLKVVSVDAEKRLIVLRTGDETLIRFGVRQSVPLNHIKAGDLVDVTFVVSELVALTSADPGLRKAEVSEERMPDGSFTNVSLAETYSVFAIDKANKKIQLHNAFDQTAWIKVNNPSVFKDAKVGDKVRVLLSLSEVADIKHVKSSR